MTRESAVRTNAMSEPDGVLDIDIRDQGTEPAASGPHSCGHFQIRVNIDGDTRQQVGGIVRPFPPRTLAFVLPHRMHFAPQPAGTAYLLVNFNLHFLRPGAHDERPTFNDASISQFPELAPFLLQEYLDFTFDESTFAKVMQLVEAMRHENDTRQFGSRELLRGLLLQLLALTIQTWRSDLVALSSAHAQKLGSRDALSRVAQYIRDNLTENISLGQAAAASFLSTGYLTRLVKKEFGKSFIDVVTEQRFERARELLIFTGLRIGDIARQCGFADEAYFTRRFRQWFGQSPSQWRDSMRARIRGEGLGPRAGPITIRPCAALDSEALP